MFIPRGDGNSDACVTGVSCSTSSPLAAAPSYSDGNSGLDTSLMEKPGTRRYIGIGMVVGLLFLIFLAWLYRGKWPRRVLHKHCCCCSRRSKQLQSVDEPRVESTPSMSSEKEGSTQEDSQKELVSADMVVFTQVPKALGGRDRYPGEWEMEHIHGIRLEVCVVFATVRLDVDSF